MTLRSGHEITQLLKAWTAGDEQALEKLAPVVHQELHRVARRCMAGQKPGHPLHPSLILLCRRWI